ncbi:MAG: hypothetical protein ACLFPB_09425, partial [Desulfovermiculus sp.]
WRQKPPQTLFFSQSRKERNVVCKGIFVRRYYQAQAGSCLKGKERIFTNEGKKYFIFCPLHVSSAGNEFPLADVARVTPMA